MDDFFLTALIVLSVLIVISCFLSSLYRYFLQRRRRDQVIYSSPVIVTELSNVTPNNQTSRNQLAYPVTVQTNVQTNSQPVMQPQQQIHVPMPMYDNNSSASSNLSPNPPYPTESSQNNNDNHDNNNDPRDEPPPSYFKIDKS